MPRSADEGAGEGTLHDLGLETAADALGDFTASRSLIALSLLAVPLGVLSAFVALALLRLIGLFTNLFFFGRLSAELISPAGTPLGGWLVLIPVLGGLVVGLMARYGSEAIRGHGIPEAIEAILVHGSRIRPRVAFLKPIASALAIGTGGPFGAEGPIIMTGGAFGSVAAQHLRLTSAERKTLLVAGAAAGMAATFATPVAAVLLSVELLLFEWKPRSLVPIGIASATAVVVRRYIMGPGPLFEVPVHNPLVGVDGLLACVLVGLLGGALSLTLTHAVYAAEDGFRKLPIHWMWWPAIGGLVVGLGGLLFPHALGVGYDTIGALLRGEVTGSVIAGVLLVKSFIWAIALGSGTSGGVLAPLLMVGGALGGIEAMFLPDEGLGFWPLVSMSATLGGTMRAPFTAVLFAIELTHDLSMLLPLLVAAVVAHGFTVLTMRRSILTEKVARRGFHLSREYSVDPLEILRVREVMRTDVLAISADALVADLVEATRPENRPRFQRLYPVVRDDGELIGVVQRHELEYLIREARPEDYDLLLGGIVMHEPVVGHPDEPLRVVVHRMAASDLTSFPVVERGPAPRLVGMISLEDLLSARKQNLEAEHRRQRVLRIPSIFRPRERSAASGTSGREARVED